MMLLKQQLQKQQQQQLAYQSTTTTTRDDDYSYYQFPTGGWFDYCSSPHYFGEMVQWLGFCVACQWSLASTSFFLFTVANLLPRGVAQHDWYRHHFNGGISRNGNQLLYPPHRKAVIPFVW
jgi:3-oxo-5-alpha-steroid 4-dehydrogenase